MNDGKKKKPQKHQNKKAFKIVFQPHVQVNHQKISLEDLCKRCLVQLQWKVQFNKYKKMTDLARCQVCGQKNIYRSYMKVCQQCSKKNNLCVKCMEKDYEIPDQVPQNPYQRIQRQKQIQHQIVQFMKNLRERSRRTIKRGLQKGIMQWSRQQQYFIDEQGKRVDGLHFKKVLEQNQNNWVDDSADQGQDDLCSDFSDENQEF